MIIGTVKQIWRYPVKSMSGEPLDQCAVSELGISGDRGWALRDEASREITNGKNLPLLMQCAARYRACPKGSAIPQVDMVLSDGIMVGSDDPKVNEALSRLLGRPLTLWPRQPASNKTHYRRASLLSRLAGFTLFRDQLPRLLRLSKVQAQVRTAFSRESGEPLPDLLQLPPELFEFTSPLGTYFDAFPLHVLTTASLKAMKHLHPEADWDVRRFRPNFLIETGADIEQLLEAGWAGRTLRIGEVNLKCEIPTVRCGMTMQAQNGLPKDPSILRSIVKNAEQNLGIYASVSQSGSVALNDPVKLA